MDLLNGYNSKFLVDDYLLSYLDGEQSKDTLIAAGVSGGKDGETAALEIESYLKTVDFRGEFVLIHSDLGIIEHKESLDWTKRLASHLKRELIIVHPTRPMLERWEYRWLCNSNRFINLERVKLVGPWSGPGAMRFCTSDEKVTPITQALKYRYPGKFIINAVGLRRDESTERAKKPVWKENKKLNSVELVTSGVDWHPILDYTIDEVLSVHERENFDLHPAYARGNSRVSCSFCVLSSKNDLEVSLRDERNHASFHRIVNLECITTYSFQNDLFLAELGFDYLTPEEKDMFAAAREKQIKRLMIEKRLTPSLLYVDGFPAYQISMTEADLLGGIRAEIGEIFGFEMKYITARDVYDRYAELIIKREKKEAEKAAKEQRQLKKQKNDINALKVSILAAAENQFEQISLF